VLRQPVAHQITRGSLEAIASSQSRWATPEEVWQAFRTWNDERGRDASLSYEERPPFFEELQDLYEFGAEVCPGLEGDGFLKLSGHCFAGILMRERLHDILAACLSPAPDIPSAIENLFLRFFEQYSGDLYRVSTTRGEEDLRVEMSFAEPEQLAKHLAKYGKIPAACFRKSFIVIVATVESCLEYLLEPWSAKNIDSNPAEGTFRVSLPEGTTFNYRKLVETLTRYTHELQRLYDERLLARDLEHNLILQGPAMREQWEKIRMASATDELILLLGEPGTGKTYLADRIHEMSPRKGRPFVEVGLTSDIGSDTLIQSQLFGHVRGAFTSAHEDKQGLFTAANTGTIFLDEIGDASPDLQAKLLRVIERRAFKPLGSNQDVTVDVRIIAATNRNLEAMVREGTFREDLFHRVNVIQFNLPPLRERSPEIPEICDHFLSRLSVEVKRPVKPIADDVLDLLSAYSWPGNIRELIHVLKYALLFSRGKEITQKDLPEYLLRTAPKTTGGTLSEGREEYERAKIIRTLEETSGNRTKAAEILGISRRMLQKKLTKYGIR
jgi:two-component system response regulator HydG